MRTTRLLERASGWYRKNAGYLRRYSGLSETVFLRTLGLIYLITFASFWNQIVALIGLRGIAPAGAYLREVHQAIGSKAYFEIPTLFWFGMPDAALVLCCAGGCVAAVVLVSGFLQRLAAAICWVLYLSLVVVGQPFTNFQWDALLLEAGFLALFTGTPLIAVAYRFLLFRLMFESGLVKLLSHDVNWRNFHALRFHFLTQPLPNPLAYYAYRLPGWVLDSMTVATFALELVVPFFLFGPKRLRELGAALLIVFQITILATGNYAFFNLLTIALCFWGLELKRDIQLHLPRPALRACSSILIVLMGIGAWQVIAMFAPSSSPALQQLSGPIAPFEIVNTYGLFAVMTTTRPEIVIEGSNDNVHWREYSFRYKPGDLYRGLPVAAPYQPRLDWQMWFAALGSYRENTWVGGLMYRLLQGNLKVLALMEAPPFAKPPLYLRALQYEYTFTTPQERSRTGAVWSRTLNGVWFGPVALKR